MNKKKILYSYFTDEDLVKMITMLRDDENYFTGEIKIVIRIKRPWFRFWKNGNYAARSEFMRQSMENSEGTTGVMLYFLLSEREFHILPTEYLSSLVPPEKWEKIRDDIIDEFRLGRYAKGALSAIRQTTEIMMQYSPKFERKEIKNPETGITETIVVQVKKPERRNPIPEKTETLLKLENILNTFTLNLDTVVKSFDGELRLVDPKTTENEEPQIDEENNTDKKEKDETETNKRKDFMPPPKYKL